MRTATAPDLPAIRSILAHAYVSDALMRWIFADDSHRLESTAAWLGLFVERLMNTGIVTVSGTPTLQAVAVWRMPGEPLPSDEGLPTVAGLLGALVGAERAGVLGQGLNAIASVTPRGPSAYLQFLAVDPEQQRRGHGTALLRAGLDEARKQDLPVHLETTNEANLAFYEAHGFEVTARIQLPPDGPMLWAMSHYPADLTSQ